MAIRPILTVPDPVLKQVSKSVDTVTDETRALMDDMLETMYAAPGIGLAAVQIGVPVRVIVMDLAKEGEPPEPRYFVNPEILETAGEMQAYEEGCLSVPDFYDLNYKGEQVEELAEGMYAVCIQHEMDHLQGTLFIDHLSRLKRTFAINKVKKAKKRDAA
jgi:peptide deformylase